MDGEALPDVGPAEARDRDALLLGVVHDPLDQALAALRAEGVPVAAVAQDNDGRQVLVLFDQLHDDG